jgi:hypothetical protein
MNTKLLMTASALLMAAGGAALLFVPHEILNYFGTPSAGIGILFVQLAGALWFGFAMMNWMAKTVLIGGIYARPLAIGNFTHFFIGALGSLKFAYAAQSSYAVWTFAVVYALFAILFGIVLFTHPLKTNNAAEKS